MPEAPAPDITRPTTTNGEQSPDSSQKSKFSRIDFKGSFIFALMILALLLPISIGGVNVPWSHPIVGSLVVISGSLGSIWKIDGAEDNCECDYGDLAEEGPTPPYNFC